MEGVQESAERKEEYLIMDVIANRVYGLNSLLYRLGISKKGIVATGDYLYKLQIDSNLPEDHPEIESELSKIIAKLSEGGGGSMFQHLRRRLDSQEDS